MRNIPYWLNIGSILYQYSCATRGGFTAAELLVMVIISCRRSISRPTVISKIHVSAVPVLDQSINPKSYQLFLAQMLCNTVIIFVRVA